jgi:NADPH:quinone reductase-like Zn-dependent oxidoreductase
MRSLVVHRYGAAADVLEVRNDTPVPQPAPDEILVQARATSVNPVDCTARNGYGRNIFSTLWGQLPLILGRDVSGVVAAVGRDVERFEPGDEVYAAPHIGCYAQYVAVKAKHAAIKPRNLTHLEAASLPFVALTVFTALVDNVGLSAANCAGKKLVIPRAAGGVGSFAIQLMKAWGAHVAAICSTRNIDLVRQLGADVIVDYRTQDFRELLSGYDVAFDTIGKPADFDTVEGTKYNAGNPEDFDERLLSVLKTHADAAYVTICSPKMVLTDRYGLEQGNGRAEHLYKERRAAQQALGRRYYWSFFNPDGEALAQVAALVEAGAIRPVIDRVFPLEQMAAAHEYCESGRAQGKIAIDIAQD